MNYTAQVYFSNRVEELFLRLKKVLFAPPSTPFTRRLVIVPSPAIKSWLMLQLAQDDALGIAAGMEIVYLDQSIQILQELFESNATANPIPNALELTLAIDWEIRQTLHDNATSSIWQPLWTYLHLEPGKKISPKSERRLAALSQKLAQLFSQYGKYAGRMVAEWEEAPDQEWQQALWNKLFCQKGSWSYLYRSLASQLNKKAISADLSVHLFSLSFLPAVQHHFLQHLSRAIPVHYYLLSPCQAFWSDIRSERESRHLKNYWKRRGASQTQQMELDTYLKECNPLLANFGRLGREMALQIEQSDMLTADQYWLPSAIQNYSQYESGFDDAIALWESTQPLTILQALQADLLVMRTPQPDAKVELKSCDSVQVHAAPTRLREVEAIYDRLLHIIHTHAKSHTPITPGDILVMAPDIMEYEPLIKMVFGTADSLLDAQIMDVRRLSHDIFVQGFMHLLDLPSSRWDVATLLQLFHYPAFQKQQRWSTEDLYQIEKWVKACGINWGLDSSQRNEIVQRAHCDVGLLDATAAGTWEFGLARLLMGLAMHFVEEKPVPIVPLEGVDMTQSELIGKLIRLIRSLRQDLKICGDGTQLPLKEWSRLLKNLCKTYFSIDKEDDDTHFLQQLDAFGIARGIPLTAVYPFASIKKYLEEALSLETVTYRESHLQAVKFCTLLPMRTVPAQVIVLMGMNEGAFPKRDQNFTLNRMKGDPKADYAPSQTDFDRYLFLEALLSARKYFLLSYTSYDTEDFKQQSPSLLVSELLNYIDKAYAMAESEDKARVSELCCFFHPFNAFDKRCFEPNSPIRSYSQSHYQQACAYYHMEKKPQHFFVPHFSIQQSVPACNDMRIDLKDLYAFAGNPLKTYFNKTLGFYIDKKVLRQWEIDEKLQLNPLESDLLKKSALSKGFHSIIEHADRVGQMPFGPFKEAGIHKLNQEFDAFRDNFGKGEIDPNCLFDIELSEQCDCPHQVDEKLWLFPALHLNVNGHPVSLVGKTPSISTKGLVAHRKKDSTDIVKIWPQCLIYHCVLNAHALNWDPRVFFVKSGKFGDLDFAAPLPLLEKYLHFYKNSLANVSPLLPEWVPLILKHDAQELQEKIEETLQDSFRQNYNDYVAWSYPNGTLPNATSVITHWKNTAQELFGDVIMQWTGRNR